MGIVAAANPLIQKPNQILIKRMSPGRYRRYTPLPLSRHYVLVISEIMVGFVF